MSFIRNYVPDCFWVISFYFMSINFTNNLTKRSLLFNSLYVILIGLIYEFLQLYNFVNGTFDIKDIIIYIVSVILACLIEIFLRRRENEKSL